MCVGEHMGCPTAFDDLMHAWPHCIHDACCYHKSRGAVHSARMHAVSSNDPTSSYRLWSCCPTQAFASTHSPSWGHAVAFRNLSAAFLPSTALSTKLGERLAELGGRPAWTLRLLVWCSPAEMQSTRSKSLRDAEVRGLRSLPGQGQRARRAGLQGRRQSLARTRCKSQRCAFQESRHCSAKALRPGKTGPQTCLSRR